MIEQEGHFSTMQASIMTMRSREVKHHRRLRSFGLRIVSLDLPIRALSALMLLSLVLPFQTLAL